MILPKNIAFKFNVKSNAQSVIYTVLYMYCTVLYLYCTLINLFCTLPLHYCTLPVLWEYVLGTLIAVDCEVPLVVTVVEVVTVADASVTSRRSGDLYRTRHT